MVQIFRQQDPSAARRQRLAEAMTKRGQRSGPVNHWTEALSRVLDTGLGAYLGNKEAKAETERKSSQMDELAKAMSGVGMASDGMGPPASVGNRLQNMEGVNPEFVMQMKLQEEGQRQAQLNKRDPIADQLAIHGGKAEIDKRYKGAQKPFEGTGIENQMLNIAMDPTIPENDPRKIAAKQRLGRAITTVTPEGTYKQPGYDVGAFGGGQGSGESEPTFIPKPATESQAKNEGFYNRMIASGKELEKLGDYNPVTLVESARGLTNVTSSENKQLYDQGAEEWIRAKLRKESGAVIGDDERVREYETYYPTFGDKAPVIAQKDRSKRVAEEAMLRGASPEFMKDLQRTHSQRIIELQSEGQETPEQNGGFSIREIHD